MERFFIASLLALVALTAFLSAQEVPTAAQPKEREGVASAPS
ncbi:MAG: hypothetical protein LKKZDAJK_000459 [Candidatus Fervidibacter sp.]